MSNIFITADEHHGHKKIIAHCSRPFDWEHVSNCTLHHCATCQRAVEKQTETIIERHNNKVPDSLGYLTIHVGDWFWHTMTLDEAMGIIKRLHGRHAFIFGNHDELIEKYRAQFEQKLAWIKGWNKEPSGHILHHNKVEITLCHYAMRVWNRSHKGSWMLYGHSHGELPEVGKSFDIGVDGHNFEPWSLEEIEAKMEKLPHGHVITKVWKGKERDPETIYAQPSESWYKTIDELDPPAVIGGAK